jgi:hypothetical protein
MNHAEFRPGFLILFTTAMIPSPALVCDRKLLNLQQILYKLTMNWTKNRGA